MQWRVSEFHGLRLTWWIQRDVPNYQRPSVCSSSVGVILENQSINNYSPSVLMLQSPAGRTYFRAGDKWMFLGNAISSPVCVPVFQWPPRAQNTSLLVHPAPSPALTPPLPAASSSQGTCNLLLFLSFERRNLSATLLFSSLQRVNRSLSMLLSALIPPPSQG